MTVECCFSDRGPQGSVFISDFAGLIGFVIYIDDLDEITQDIFTTYEDWLMQCNAEKCKVCICKVKLWQDVHGD